MGDAAWDRERMRHERGLDFQRPPAGPASGRRGLRQNRGGQHQAQC